MREKMMNFMRGRYGFDRFTNFLMGFACVIIFINIFIRSNVVNLLGLAVFIYAYYRIFSKNISKRSAENTWYLNKTYGIRRFFLKGKDQARIRRTHHIYKCPKCGQKMKVPRGRGKIEVTCPKCRYEFVKRS